MKNCSKEKSLYMLVAFKMFSLRNDFWYMFISCLFSLVPLSIHRKMSGNSSVQVAEKKSRTTPKVCLKKCLKKLAPPMGRSIHSLGSHRRRILLVEEPEDQRGRGQSMEHSESAPVLPVAFINQ